MVFLATRGDHKLRTDRLSLFTNLKRRNMTTAKIVKPHQSIETNTKQMKKAIYKFFFDCGRMGELEGIFVAKPKDVKRLVDSGEELYFGEVLGKHSEICGVVTLENFIFVTDEEEIVNFFEIHEMATGINPLSYFEEEGAEDDINEEDSGGDVLSEDHSFEGFPWN